VPAHGPRQGVAIRIGAEYLDNHRFGQSSRLRETPVTGWRKIAAARHLLQQGTEFRAML
jgi:hypothetical protein